MTFIDRVLTLVAATLAATAIASPALAQTSGDAPDTGSGAGSQPSADEPSGGNADCDEACQERRLAEEKRQQEEAKAREEQRQREAAAREAERRRLQAAIDREQAEADALEEQAELCAKQPSRAGCNPYASSVAKPKPAQPKPAPYVASQQQKASRHGNPAGVGVRPVVEPQEENGAEDAVDVPDIHQFAIEADPVERMGSRNLVWFSVVAMAAIASLGYGLWRILFVEGR